jgi:hypothetical protein
MIGSTHDQFHEPTLGDPNWQETTWFTIAVPDRNLYCYVYPWVRPNQDVLGGGVMVWDNLGRNPWDALHWDYQWTYPYPYGERGDLRDIKFPNGVGIECLEPLNRYHITYEHPFCSLDVVFEGMVPAHIIDGGDSNGTFTGHLDQQGHITGTITVSGETHNVDCYGVRDRSWGPRVPRPGMHVGYNVCASASSAFVLTSMPDVSGSPIVKGFGYVWHDGKSVAPVTGTSMLERDGIWPKQVTVQVTDEQGREIQAIGTMVNHMAFQNLPTMMNIVSLVRWEYKDPSGKSGVGWGEYADVWDMELFRPWVRERRNAGVLA